MVIIVRLPRPITPADSHIANVWVPAAWGMPRSLTRHGVWVPMPSFQQCGFHAAEFDVLRSGEICLPRRRYSTFFLFVSGFRAIFRLFLPSLVTLAPSSSIGGALFKAICSSSRVSHGDDECNYWAKRLRYSAP